MIRVSSLVGISFLLVAATLPGGENVWTTNGPPGQITALTAESEAVFAGSFENGKGVGYRGIDGNPIWTPIGEVPLYWSISDLAVDPTDPDRVYAAANYGQVVSAVYRSEDGGHTWNHVASLHGPVFDLVVRPDRPGTLYAASMYCFRIPAHLPSCTAEIQKSLDSGETWIGTNAGLLGSSVFSIAFDATDPNRIYAGGDAGVFVSSDAGENWSASNEGLRCVPTYALVIRASDGTIFAGSGEIVSYRFVCGGVSRSTDGGRTWTSTGLPPHFVKSIALDPMDPWSMYAASIRTEGFFHSYGGVFRSTDDGATWIPFGAGLPDSGVSDLVIDATGRRLHAATAEGVFDIELTPDARLPIAPSHFRGTRTLPVRP